MKEAAIALTLLLTLSLVSADLSFASFNGDFSSSNSPSGALPLSALATVANYYGCKTWVQQQCTECSFGFYFNNKGVCCQAPDLCSQFNTAMGLCVSCYQGYVVYNNSCVLAAEDTGCGLWNGNKCAQCSKGWYFNVKGACTPVSDQCYTWDENTGACLSCYNGYVLSAGACRVNPNPQTGAKDPNCATWIGSACGACSARAYFNANGVCTLVSDQCQTWNPKNGNCLTCYGGYSLVNGACSQSAIVFPADAGCGLWNSQGNICLQCSNRYFFNGKQCTPVSDQCNTWNANGACLTCYAGYDLYNDGTCRTSTKNSQPSDAGCATWDWKNQKCLQCSNNWVFNNFGACVPVSTQCQTFDRLGNCVSCYVGYNLQFGQCVQAPIQQVNDNGCATWDWKNQKCLQCSNNWVFNKNGVCVTVSDQCQTFNPAGACVSCYVGYNLQNGQCIQADVQRVADLGCGTWDWKNRKCLQCSNNWVFNAKGACVPVSDQCQTFNPAGACVSCYVGYNLKNGLCVQAPVQQVADNGCGTWDWKNQKCLQCSNNWVFNAKGLCVPVSSQCNTFNSAGACLSCYTGYNLQNGQCVQAPVESVKDLGCGLWDWTNKKCLQCSNNWVFNNNGVCIQVSSQCKTFDLAGNCASCYVGYNLVGSQCVQAPIQTVSDVGCGTWDWVNQKCLACSNNWVFNKNGVCVTVSDQCQTFNPSGACVSCYLGYNLQNGQCVLAPIQKVADLGCGTWDWTNQVCLACSNRFVFNAQRQCVPVSDNCQIWDKNGLCTGCYSGYILRGGQCTLGNSLCQASNSNGACTSCYSGYILDNGNCVSISNLANLALYYSVCCPERLATLSNNVGGDDAGHVKYHA